MNQNFGPAALRLSGLAARLLGWRPGEFWGATPAELAAILDPVSHTEAGLTRSDLHHLMERDR